MRSAIWRIIEILTLINSENGSVVRRIPTGSISAHTVVDARRGWFILFGESGLRVLDAISGRTIRTVRLGLLTEELGVDPAADDAFVLSETAPNTFTRRVLRVNLSTGRVSRGIRYGTIGPPQSHQYSQVTTAVDGAAHRLFVIPQNGTLGVFDTRTGSFLGKWRFSLRFAERVGLYLDMAIDQSTHRLFIGGTKGVVCLDSRARLGGLVP